MKAVLLFFVVMTVSPIFCLAQNDDMYFVPKKNTDKLNNKEIVINENNSKEQTLNSEYTQVQKTQNERDVDEYNRRYMWNSSEESENNENIEEQGSINDSYEYESDEESGGDYEYSKRILRFYSPSVGIPVSSSLYWDLCYGPNSIYWDVYDDGCYAYVFPSSWNYLYYTPYSPWYPWGISYYSWRYWNTPWGYPYWAWHHPWYNGWYHNSWHHHWGSSRPVYRPSVYRRETTTLNRGNSQISNRRTNNTLNRNNYSGTRVTPSRNNSVMRPVRNTTTRIPEKTTNNSSLPRRSNAIQRSTSVSFPARSNSTVNTPMRSNRVAPVRSNRR